MPTERSRPDTDEIVALSVAAVAIALALVAPWRARHAHAAPPLPEPIQVAIPSREIHVPHASDAIHLDGELTEPSWLASARTGAFLSHDGTAAVPYSDARFVWTDVALRVGLYASDEDIVSAKVPADGPVWEADAFHVVFTKDGTERVFDVGPTCVLADGVRRAGGSTDYKWQSHAELACDSDGTVDVSGDHDEEWVVEMVIPLSALGVTGRANERVEVRVRRCDSNSERNSEPLRGVGSQATLRHTPKRCAETGPLLLMFDP